MWKTIYHLIFTREIKFAKGVVVLLYCHVNKNSDIALGISNSFRKTFRIFMSEMTPNIFVI